MTELATQEQINQVNEEVGAEGWGLFDCDGSLGGPLQVQAIADFGHYAWGDDADDDAAAWTWIFDRAAEGSIVHLQALALLQEENPLEFERILAFCDSEGVDRFIDDPKSNGIPGWAVFKENYAAGS